MIWEDLTIDEVFCAYEECRKNKTQKETTAEFEINLFINIYHLYKELKYYTYKIGTSIKFIVLRPKPREVWAANFRDRIVQHVIHRRVKDQYFKSFIYDSCACIPAKGTHFGVKRLDKKVRSVTNNFQKEAYYLKCDYKNFFISINKNILFDIIKPNIKDKNVLYYMKLVIFHDPTKNFTSKSSSYEESLVEPHKLLLNQVSHKGLAIGNISSQLFANIYLNYIDQYIKRELKIKHYIRYVDDFVLLHEDPKVLMNAYNNIVEKSKDLELTLNPKKTLLHSVYRGIDFIGYVIKPRHIQIRKKTFNKALRIAREYDSAAFSSYKGMLTQGNNYNYYKKFRNEIYKYL